MLIMTIENQYWRYQCHSLSGHKLIGCGIISSNEFPAVEILKVFRGIDGEVGVTYSSIDEFEYKRLTSSNCMDHLWFGRQLSQQKFVSTIGQGKKESRWKLKMQLKKLVDNVLLKVCEKLTVYLKIQPQNVVAPQKKQGMSQEWTKSIPSNWTPFKKL